MAAAATPASAGLRPALRRIGASLLSLVLAASVAAATPERHATPAHVEVVAEIQSYGEQYRDLRNLLVPFLAANRFYEPTRRLPYRVPDGGIAFDGPLGDFVVTVGRYNCAVVVYYSTWTGRSKDGASALDRADAFTIQLGKFLDGLPEPRPTLRIATLGSRPCASSG